MSLFSGATTTRLYNLSLHDALPISVRYGLPTGRISSFNTTRPRAWSAVASRARQAPAPRSEEHTSELQSLRHLVCRLLLEKKNIEYGLKRWSPVEEVSTHTTSRTT